MKRENKHYSREFKIKAVELSLQRGELTSVAKELGLRSDALSKWKKEYRESKFDTNFIKPTSKEEEELIRLRKELHETKLERDILKKAVSIFSKSDR
jgi:transposase